MIYIRARKPFHSCFKGIRKLTFSRVFVFFSSRLLLQVKSLREDAFQQKGTFVYYSWYKFQ